MTASQTTMKETIEIEPSKTGLVSIIVPCFGQLEYTRICVPRLLRFSRSPFELIFIDGGVLDGTSEYLAGVTALPSARVEIVEAPAEAGLPAACAVGLKHAQGEYVVFMSNETVVGERWLNHLVAAAKVAPEIGMVGTMSNLCPPPQWVGKLPYRIGLKKTANGSSGPGSFPLDLEAVDQFASDWCEKHRGQSFEVERLGGSCLLIKAEVFKKIDLGETPSPFGSIDGDLLSMKVLQAGYRLVCCRDLFMHQFGSRIFAGLRIDPTLQVGNPSRIP